jgi:hypothetical protein
MKCAMSSVEKKRIEGEIHWWTPLRAKPRQCGIFSVGCY